MGEIFAIAVMAAIPAGAILFAWRELLNLRRSRRWVRTEAIVCADVEALDLPRSQQPKRGHTVMLKGPNGPCVASLRYSHANRLGFEIGTTIPVIHDPNDPARVEGYYPLSEHIGRLLFIAGLLALMALSFAIHVLTN